MTFTRRFLDEVKAIAERIDPAAIERLAEFLADVRARGGRLFCLGVGGGAAYASHAVSDFRTLAGIEAYAPTDNASEITARTNDEGWEASYAGWLRASRIGPRDAVLVFSVGGGDPERGVSANLVRALELARAAGAGICGVVGRDGGYTSRVATVSVIVPTVNPAAVTAHTEAFQAVVWHLLVSHPRLRQSAGRWESLTT